MWFKNLLIYRLTSSIEINDETLQSALSEHAFSPCGKLDPVKIGWTNPVPNGGNLYHAGNGCWILCAKKQEKILPSGVIREKLEEKVQLIEDKEDRKVYRKEKDSLKDEIIFDCLPQAFTRSQRIFLSIDTKNGFIYVDSSSFSKAEELLKLLRQSLGSLPLAPLQTVESPQQTLTQWIGNQSTPQTISLLDECELKEPGEEGSVVKCRRMDLYSQEITQHLDGGSLVSKLSLNWSDQLRCVVQEDLSIKRLKFDDKLVDESQENSQGDAAALFDSDFQIMMQALRGFTETLIEAFGGIKAEGI